MIRVRRKKFTVRRAQKTNKAWRIIRLLIVIILGAVLVVSGVAITDYLISGQRDMQGVETARHAYYALVPSVRQDGTDIEDSSSKSESSEKNFNDNDAMDAYATLLEINSEAVGWISIPGTDIDYPIAQAKDNNYYLSHNFDRKKSSHASIFMDCQNEEEDLNIVIYGHNMKDGTFFGKLELFLDDVYCENHPIIEMNLWGQMTHWKIFSVHIMGDEMVPLKFESSEQFEKYIEQMKKLSDFDLGIDIGADAKMLTLSTCGFGSTNRVLVQAVKIEN